jgi:predicted regulator of Ras-like GTPase activity (Roadblock/LC7/MglB family)
MKSGKVLFSWQEVAGWIKPPLLIPPTPKVGEMAVELPLKVLAPLFMAHHRAAVQKRLSIDENIPDLFAGGNGNGADAQVVSAAPAPTVAPSAPSGPVVPPAPAARTQNVAPTIPASPALRMVTPTPAPTPVLVTAPVKPASPAATPSQAPAQAETSLEQVVGEADKRFSAKEIIARSARLPGTIGALLVMSDGLLVTSQAPADVKAETIAAFLPQMFGRMNQYTKELALGPLQHLTLGVENGTWHVIKCANIYFAVLGKRGETLPLNLLAQVAAELSSQSN